MTNYPKIGSKVIVMDFSEAHGQSGLMWDLQNGIGLVLLDEGCIWPVDNPGDLWTIDILGGMEQGNA